MNELPATRLFDRNTPPHIATLIILACVSALSMTMFLPSLPEITEHFKSDYRLMQLSVSSYLFVTAILQVVIGPLADRYGRRPVMLWSLALFVLATIGCVLSPTAEVFLAFRMAQAVIATGMVLSRAIVRDMVSTDRAASMIAYVTMGMAIAPMLAPALGGALDEAFGWQSNFLFQIAIGAIILAFCFFDLGETTRSRHSSMARQFKDYPELFGSRRFWGYCAASATTSGAFFAFLGGAPYVGTTIYGLGATEMGIYIGLPAFGYMVGNFISGRSSMRVGINRMIVIGSLVGVVGLSLPIALVWLGANHPFTVFGLMIFLGIGNGMVMPTAMAGMLSVRPHLAGTASGIGGAIMIGGGSGLSALAGALLNEESSPYPLLLLMLASILLGLVAAAYIVWVAKKAGPL